MRIIEITALSNGAHRNQESSGVLPVPAGWAVIPDDLLIPDTFPFVEIVVADSDEESVPFVVSMTAGVVPDPEPDVEPDVEVSDTDVLNVLLGVDE